MSKRLCTSLLAVPRRTYLAARPQCGRQPVSLLAVHGSASPPHSPPRCPPARVVATAAPACRRTLSTTSRRPAGASARIAGAKRRGNLGASIAVQRKKQEAEMLGSGEMLEHIGVLEDTFVMPARGSRLLPSWFASTAAARARLTLEWLRLKTGVWNRVLSHAQARFMVRPRLALDARAVPRLARDLYEAMYAAVAAADLTPVQDRLLPGLRARLAARVADRARGAAPPMAWTLHRYLTPPTCVSHRFVLTGLEGAKDKRQGVQQAVVRLHSLQSLVRRQRRMVPDAKTRKPVLREVMVDHEGGDIPVEREEEYQRANAKETIEYVVVQRILHDSTPGPWRLWGMTEEHSIDKVRKEKREKIRKMAGAGAKA